MQSGKLKKNRCSGGLLIYLGVLLFFLFYGFAYPWFFAGLSLIAVISLADGTGPQSFMLRLLLHFAALGLMFYQLGFFCLPWYVSLPLLLVCAGILNIYRSMDGIRGMTGGYSLVLIAAFWYINRYQVAFVNDRLLILLLLALLVFNILNFTSKSGHFAGDVGAITMAFIVVFLLGRLIMQTGDGSYLMLLALYGVDSVLTIVHRLLLKENIFKPHRKPHRKHLYQLMANELKIPHLLVSSIYMLLQALIVAGQYSIYIPAGQKTTIFTSY